MSGRRKTRSAPGVRPRENRDGSISYQIRWQAKDGSPQSATRDSFEEAVEYRAERLREIRLGASGDISGGRITFGAWFEQHHLPAKERSGRQSTHATRRSYYRNHIAPDWGTWKLADIDVQDVEAWLLRKTDELSTGSCRKLYGYFRQAMRRAHRQGRILVDPTGLIDLGDLGLAAEPSEPRFLDPIEAILLENSIDDHWKLTIPFLTDSGLRIGELAALRVRALDLLRGAVRVEATVAKDRTGKIIEGPPKTAAGRRTVPTLGPDLVDRLRDHIADRQLGPDDYLFAGERGGRINPDNWRTRVFRPAVDAAGLAAPLPTPHSLRHTAVSLWIASGMCKTETQVAQFAGHRKLASVYELYGHLFESSSEDLRERMQAFRVAARLELDGRDDEVVELHQVRRPGRTG